MARMALKEFMLANPMYKGATITAFTVDEDGEATVVKATLWADLTSQTQLENPQTCNSQGRFKQAVYIDVPVILTVTGLSVPSHDTGIIAPVNVIDMRTKVTLEEDFLGDSINTFLWGSSVGSDGQIVAPAIVAGSLNGLARMTTGDDAAASMAVNGVQLHSALNYRASDGGLVLEVKLKVSAITDVCLFLGFTDQVAALEMPFTLAGSNVLTSNASDAVGALFDTAADSDDWWLVGVAADVDATKEDSDVAPVADTLEHWRIEITDDGTARFFRNGESIGDEMEDAVTPGTALTPVIAAFSRGAASRNVDADLVYVEKTR